MVEHSAGVASPGTGVPGLGISYTATRRAAGMIIPSGAQLAEWGRHRLTCSGGTAMEYLVTMTTHVPDGTPEADVEDIRTREAVRSGELARQGQLLRLWRPPLQPGEWRTLGLFAADDAGQLEEVLASMPLAVWRSDDATPLEPHPNDPAGTPAGAGGQRHGQHPDGPEFLTTFTDSVPGGTPAEEVDIARAREADRTRELGKEGHLERLWRLPGDGHALGLWRATDEVEMETILESLPLYDWMTVQTTPLTPHPSDPGR